MTAWTIKNGLAHRYNYVRDVWMVTSIQCKNIDELIDKVESCGFK